MVKINQFNQNSPSTFNERAGAFPIAPILDFGSRDFVDLRQKNDSNALQPSSLTSQKIASSLFPWRKLSMWVLTLTSAFGGTIPMARGSGLERDHERELTKESMILSGSNRSSSISNGSIATANPQAPGQPLKGIVSTTLLTDEWMTRYKNINSWFPYLESLDSTQPASSAQRAEGLQRLQGYWNDLRREAQSGNTSAKIVLQGLWANRMLEELERPNPNMIRLDYAKFGALVTQLQQGKITESTFKTEVQHRALVGLYCYYRDNDTANPLTENPQRFFEPVMKLLENNPNKDIQQWGGYLMNQIFARLTPAQKQTYLNRMTTSFLKSPDSPEKLSAMRSLYWLNLEAPDIPGSGNSLWGTFIKEVQAQLKEQFQTQSPEQQESGKKLAALAKYNITLLGLFKAPDTGSLVLPGLSANRPEEVQLASAWVLGRTQSEAGFKALIRFIGQSDASPLAREMAILSLTEYHPVYGDVVTTLLKSLANPPSSSGSEGSPEAVIVPDALKEAAQAMLQKITDQSASVKDYYIDLFLKTDEEKTSFKSLRDQYVTGLDLLNTAQKNLIDRSLLPYRHFLQEIINRGGKHTIMSGGVGNTEAYKQYIGARSDDGRLTDLIQGMSSDWGGAVTSVNRVTPGGSNTFAHEFTHHIHQMILNHQAGVPEKIVALYQEAMKDKKVLDDYGATNEYEYLAQGGEAMDGQYKDHRNLYNAIFNRGYDTGGDNTRSKLKRQDPKLYEFLKSLRSIPLEIQLKVIKAYNKDLYAQLRQESHYFRRQDQSQAA